MTQIAHSSLGASSMYRWANCPGSVRLSKEAPPAPSSRYAEEGTLAHDHAAYRLDLGYWRHDIEQEMQDAVQVYTSAVLAEVTPETKTFFEHRFDLSSIYPGCFGTADAVLYHSPKRLLQVFDYKHGAGIPVEVEGNSQLKYYGLGALLSLKLPVETVELIIVQPRCVHRDGPVRRTTFPAIELMDFAADLYEFAKATEDPNAKFESGDHCHFCPAKGICPELKTKAQAVAKTEFAPAGMTVDEIAETLERLPILEAWIGAINSHAYQLAERGTKIPGFKLVAKRASRKWLDVTDAARKLEHEFPQLSREFYDSSLKSVPQVEKLLPPSSKDFLSELSVSVSSGNTLVRESDPRQEIKVLDARTEFLAADLFS
jgi:hypothetical protein